jgi:hypothetical protein
MVSNIGQMTLFHFLGFFQQLVIVCYDIQTTLLKHAIKTKHIFKHIDVAKFFFEVTISALINLKRNNNRWVEMWCHL